MASSATPDLAPAQIDAQFEQMRRESDALLYTSEQVLETLKEQFPNSEFLGGVVEKIRNPDDR